MYKYYIQLYILLLHIVINILNKLFNILFNIHLSYSQNSLYKSFKPGFSPYQRINNLEVCQKTVPM